jgi:uncharacterized damage-inducible protein DinB
MTMLEHIKNLFSYDEWANREVLDSLQAVATPPARSINLMAHIVSAERLWLERLLVKKQTLPVWPQFTLEQCKREIEQISGLWKNHLASLGEEGLPGSTTYRNTKGEGFTSQKQDILLHIIMHSAYHRGQIAADMRAAGFTPASTDFIHAVRQGFVDQAPNE